MNGAFDPGALFANGANPYGSSFAGSGQIGMEDLRKALTAGYGTDLATLQGGGAMRVESLEATLMATVQQNKHFRLFNKLKKNQANATVDEWVEQSGVGGFVGGAVNSELGDLQTATGEYARRVAQVKYLMTRRAVSYVQQQASNIVDAMAIEAEAGAKELLSTAEYLFFEGDSAVIPEEYDGLEKIVAATGNVIDLAGASFSPDVAEVIEAASRIAAAPNYGTPTDLFLSPLAQADLDIGLNSAYRVNLDNNPATIQKGAPVAGIRTTWGNIETCPDVFLTESPAPFEVRYPALASASDPAPPAQMGFAVAADATSKFGAGHAGTYWYRVEAISRKGGSTSVVAGAVGTETTPAAATVTAGDIVTLTIADSPLASGYAIYRSRRNMGAQPAASDYRLIGRVASAGAGGTTFVDTNSRIPGTSSGFVLNMAPGDQAIGWRQLLPMSKFPLFPTNKVETPWAQLLFGYLRVTKAKQHYMIKNILPSRAAAQWSPF